MKLVFVYNAEAGLVRGFMDSIHKVASPSTYACGLCAITYGLTSMKPKWRTWLKELDIQTEFFHRADFWKAWPDTRVALPAILLEDGHRLTPVIGADAFTKIKDVDQLISVLEGRLAKVKHDHPTL